MHALDDTDRTAVLLRYFENKSLREVGVTLGTSDDAAWILDAAFPEELAIPAEQQPGVFLAALRSFIDDVPAITAASPALSPDDLQRLRETFASSSLKPLLL